MEQYLSIAEHAEYARRMDDEHKRQNHRLEELEKSVAQNNKLLISVEKLALSMETMQAEQAAQGDRLEALESRDGEMWRKVVSHIVLAIVGAVIGFALKSIGL